MITIREISENKNKFNDRIRITTTIKSVAIDFKDFYDMDYIRFHSGISRCSSRFELNKRHGIRYANCKETIRGIKGIDLFLHDYEYTATGTSIPALSKYFERWRS